MPATEPVSRKSGSRLSETDMRETRTQPAVAIRDVTEYFDLLARAKVISWK